MSDTETLKEIRDNVSSLSNTMAGFLAAQTVLNDSQKSINETNTNMLSKISESMVKSEAMQSEMNGQSQRITELSVRQSATEDKVSFVSEQVAVNKSILNHVQDLKKVWTKAGIGMFFAILVSTVALVYGTAAKQEASEKTTEQLKSALTELLARKE